MYPTAGGNNIGNLLRMIQEENQQNPIITQNPQTQVGNPVRQSVLEPVKQSEAPDSSRVAVVRPESAPVVGGEQPQVTPPAPGVVAPIAPAPAAPTPPSVGPMRSSTAMPSATPAARPSLAPNIMPTISKASPSARPSAAPAPAKSTKPNVPGSSISAGKPTGQAKLSSAFLTTGSGSSLVSKIIPNLVTTATKGLVKASGGGLLDVGGYIRALDNILKGKSNQAPKKSVNT